jgi:hypothetical protein
VLALGLLAFFYGSWFGYTYWTKLHVPDKSVTRSHLKQPRAA